jgi:NAD(P)H-dependent flavin oxidoreductase YrpB (nitropropane dioxygenase family)
VNTKLCKLLGVELPLVAFSAYPEVVAAVTNAGGFGVLGATNYTPEELDDQLAWIDRAVEGRPYGADVVWPERYEGAGEALDVDALVARIPEEHRRFASGVLSEHGLDIGAGDTEFVRRMASMGLPDQTDQLIDVAFSHPIKLIANALGVPPAAMIERGRAEGVPVAALVGAREHAIRQVEAGVDIVVACGHEAGGHTGEVTTLVVVPEVLAAVRATSEIPVLAAGGIITGRQMAAALALGADGVWTGSVWMTTTEAGTPAVAKQKMLAAGSRDTVRSRGRTGKPARQLRSAWTEAWDAEETPAPLPMPMQSMLVEPYLRRIDTLAAGGHAGAQELATFWIGQGVGLLDRERPAREVVESIRAELLEASQSLARVVFAPAQEST